MFRAECAGTVVVPGSYGAWSGHRGLVFAVLAGAPTAKGIALEEAQAIGADLEEIPAPDPLAAPVAHGAPLGDATGGHDVRAMAVRGEAPALATVALGTGADADLVGTDAGAGGDDVAAGALVAVEDLVAVELEEAEAAQDVGWFGGGGARGLRYSCVDQESLLLVRAPGC